MAAKIVLQIAEEKWILVILPKNDTPTYILATNVTKAMKESDCNYSNTIISQNH